MEIAWGSSDLREAARSGYAIKYEVERRNLEDSRYVHQPLTIHQSQVNRGIIVENETFFAIVEMYQSWYRNGTARSNGQEADHPEAKEPPRVQFACAEPAPDEAR